MADARQESAEQYTKRVLKKGGRAKKSLGQNFLIDDQIIEAIVQTGLPDPELPLIEIGPGPGALTRKLIENTNRLWAVELDQEKIEILQKEFAGQIELLHMDALKLNLKDLWGEEKGWLIGNLPYYITNPLLEHFLAQKDSLRGLTVMVQKEVARRMTAKPGGKEYGLLSIAIQLYAEAEILFDVPPAAFRPQPKVTSTVIRLKIRPYPGFSADQKAFFRVVRAAFAQRRKTLHNTLSSGLNLPKETVDEILRSAGISPNSRAEELGIIDYQNILLAIKGPIQTVF